MFFITSLLKLLLIAAMFMAISRLAGPAVLFFVQGLAMIYLGIIGAGLHRPPRGGEHGA